MEDTTRREEENKLKETIVRIDQMVNEYEQWLNKSKAEVGGGETEREVRRIYEKEKRNLQQARPTPYFGRVNFEPDSSAGGVEIYYIGKYHIRVDYVYSMWAPVAGLYYDPTSNGYTVPSGKKITGVVRLSRHLQIENTNLIDYKDVYRLPVPGVKGILVGVEESPLTRVLSKPKSTRLPDIVQTIQPQQYQQIVAGFRGLMMIQGVAGSGKSEIGIHRLAYLLSPHNELNLNILPENVILFGPSKVFLKYISSVLPGLEVPRVKQTTIFDWLRSTLSHPVKIESIDRIFERSLKGPSREVEKEIQVAKLKGSVRMARIIDKYVQMMRTQFIENRAPIVIGGNATIAKARIKRIARHCSERRLNEQRKQVLQQLKGEVQKKLTKVSDPQLEMEIETKFSEFWPEVDFADAYFGLLSNRDLLAKASRKILTENELQIVVESAISRPKKFRREDLPALCYLDHSINDRLNARKKRRKPGYFSHIVVDEAQDVSPLELTILRFHSRNDSFTILGDIGQHLLPHKGVSSWREVRGLFPRQNVQRWEAPYSYRSTYEIMKYAKQILIKTDPKAPRPRPYKRHGERPVFIRSKTFKDMIDAIASDISMLEEQGIQTVAVLCRTAKEASRVHKKLVRAGIDHSVLLDKQNNYDAKVFVSSILMSKGLEYDAVILANARKRNYLATEINNKMLYIAVTRAAHRLHIHWFGSIAEVLAVPGFYEEPKKSSHRSLKKNVKKL